MEDYAGFNEEQRMFYKLVLDFIFNVAMKLSFDACRSYGASSKVVGLAEKEMKIIRELQEFITDDITTDIHCDEDVVGAWLAECCKEDSRGWLPAQAAYESFESWFENNVGRRVPSQEWFGQHLALRAKKVRDVQGIFYHGFRFLRGVAKYAMCANDKEII